MSAKFVLSRSCSAFLPALAFASLALAASAPSANAQVVFDNGGPARVTGYVSDTDLSVFQNDTFSFSGSTTFDTVQWWGLYASRNTPQATDSFTLTLHNTTAGVPDTTPFVTFTLGNNVSRTPDGATGGIPAYSVFRYTATLSAPVTLGPGTYGLGIVNDTTSDDDDDWYWGDSTVPGQHFRRSEADSYTTRTGNLAFNLQNVNAVAPVPEPSTWAGMGMASFALCGLMVRARRKARS